MVSTTRIRKIGGKLTRMYTSVIIEILILAYIFNTPDFAGSPLMIMAGGLLIIPFEISMWAVWLFFKKSKRRKIYFWTDVVFFIAFSFIEHPFARIFAIISIFDIFVDMIPVRPFHGRWFIEQNRFVYPFCALLGFIFLLKNLLIISNEAFIFYTSAFFAYFFILLITIIAIIIILGLLGIRPGYIRSKLS